MRDSSNAFVENAALDLSPLHTMGLYRNGSQSFTCLTSLSLSVWSRAARQLLRISAWRDCFGNDMYNSRPL